MLPVHAVQKEVAEGRLRAWPFDPPLIRAIHLAQPTDRPLSHATRAIEGLCRTTMAELVRSGVWPCARMCVST